MTPSQDSERKLFDVSESGGSDVQKLAEQMSEVRGLPETVLRYTQHFYKRVGEGLTDPTRAAVILGPRVVGHIAIQHRMASGLDSARLPNGVGHRLWSDCIHRAIAARLMAARTKAAHPDLAFTAGLALEWGVGPMLIEHGQHLRWLAQVRNNVGAARLDAEREFYGETHMQAFDRQANDWGLPPWLIAIVHLHKEPVSNSTPLETAGLQRICSWADDLAEAMNAPAAGPELERVVNAAASLGVHPDDAWRIVKQTLSETSKIGEMLDVDVSPQPTLDDLKARTGDYRSLHGGEWATLVQAENTRLRAELDEAQAALSRAVREDPVTRLPTHRTFLELAGTTIKRTMHPNAFHSMVVVDIDNFNEINERHGFKIGDKLLAYVATRLRGVTAADNVYGRVGGNAFAIFIPGDPRNGQVIAERARACIEGMHLDVGGARIEITATVVGVTQKEPTTSDTVKDLLTRAFREQKAAGSQIRNRVLWSR
ncbi:MAG: diguanylate cyclase (GGDEF)-like protein [Myxococcota bacterium]|jgi:diguanylate cyclase (GGDEF)-like protein